MFGYASSGITILRGIDRLESMESIVPSRQAEELTTGYLQPDTAVSTNTNSCRDIPFSPAKTPKYFDPEGYAMFPISPRWPDSARKAAVLTPAPYVPSDQLDKYRSCSGVSRSIFTPIDSSFILATCLSSSSGTA